MSKPVIQIGTELREMNDAEYAQWQLDIEAMRVTQAAMAAVEAARESALGKLAALGLTADEIAALVG